MIKKRLAVLLALSLLAPTLAQASDLAQEPGGELSGGSQVLNLGLAPSAIEQGVDGAGACDSSVKDGGAPTGMDAGGEETSAFEAAAPSAEAPRTGWTIRTAHAAVRKALAPVAQSLAAAKTKLARMAGGAAALSSLSGLFSFSDNSVPSGTGPPQPRPGSFKQPAGLSLSKKQSLRQPSAAAPAFSRDGKLRPTQRASWQPSLRLAVFIAALLVSVWASPARAKQLSLLQDDEVGFGIAYAKAMMLDPNAAPDRSFVTGSIRWSTPFSRVNGWGRIPNTDRLRLLVEPNAGWFQQLNRAPFAGVNVMLRGYLWDTGRFLPFAGLGGGALVTDFSGLGSRLNFTLLAGAGFDYILAPHLTLQAEYRFHHISNADIKPPNIGINSNYLSVGLSKWFDVQKGKRNRN